MFRPRHINLKIDVSRYTVDLIQHAIFQLQRVHASFHFWVILAMQFLSFFCKFISCSAFQCQPGLTSKMKVYKYIVFIILEGVMLLSQTTLRKVFKKLVYSYNFAYFSRKRRSKQPRIPMSATAVVIYSALPYDISIRKAMHWVEPNK